MTSAVPTQTDDRAARANARLLAIGQALGGSGTVAIIAAGGLVGHMLADNKALATLPVSGFILGTALATLPANMLMRHVGRRSGYILGAASAIIASLVAALGIYQNSFWLFTFGLALSGINWAFVHSYRFAAADMASDLFKAKAISWVLIGGVASAVIGPQLVLWTKDLLPPFLFLGSFLGAAALGVGVLLVIMRIDIPKPPPPAPDDGARPLGEIIARPRFVVAVLCGAVSYAIMTLVMTATPLAMVGCGLSSDLAVLGIQWHVLAMFVPSFFTGNLINRFGKEWIVAAGMALLAVSAGVALAGLSLWHFWIALILLGLGWNFGFIGATAMVTDVYAPAERNKVQGFNDFLVFGLNALASFSSGLLLNLLGWSAVNLLVFPAVFLCLAALVWLAGAERRPALAG